MQFMTHDKFQCIKNRYGTRANVTLHTFADIWNNLANVNALPYNLFRPAKHMFTIVVIMETENTCEWIRNILKSKSKNDVLVWF